MLHPHSSPSRPFREDTCYKDWKASSDHTDNDWILLIYDFIARDLKVPYDYYMCESQRKNFIQKNRFTNKGIYFTLKYFYEIKKGDWGKSHQGIGIVPYIYKEATEYWIQKELSKRGTIAAIEEQIRQRANQEKITLTMYKKQSIRKKIISLDKIKE